MKRVTDISRILVGALFIFSGLIKANDPLGFSYKLEEYWIEFGMAWPWLTGIGVPLASAICIVEIVLGVAVLISYRVRLTSILLMGMILFFSALTFASAVFGLVKSCGCFGDAIPLTPWQSFIKDVILLLFILVIFIFRNEISAYDRWYKEAWFYLLPAALIGWASMQVGWLFPFFLSFAVLAAGFILYLSGLKNSSAYTIALSVIASVMLCHYSLSHLPLKDFRPYAIGKSIPEQMKLPEGAKADVYENVFKYRNKKTGSVEEFTESNYPWNDSGYVFVDRVTTLIEKGDEAKITDFSIVAGDGYDMTEDVLYDPQAIVLIITSRISKAERSADQVIRKLAGDCGRAGISVIGLTASDAAASAEYGNSLGITFYATDETTLKTMVRSNPGIVLLLEGRVMGMWHYNDCPAEEELKNLLQ